MNLEYLYEQWMFNKFTGHFCKDDILEMCEDSLYWEVFLEDTGEDE